MSLPKNGGYKVLRFPKGGAIATRTPSYPAVCPQCGNKRKPTTDKDRNREPEQRTATYECGGVYGPLAANDPHWNFYGGTCPQASQPK